MTEIVKRNESMSAAVEQVVVAGDLTPLQPAQRVEYYRKVCESLGLNPFTKPFDYINLNGKLTLYARKDATEQLRKIHGVSIVTLEGELVDDLYIVSAVAQARDGRLDQAKGAVAVGNLKGEAKANAIMKAETKAKRRVTLSICGLGWTDESEVDSIPAAHVVPVDTETGEILQSPRTVTPSPVQHRTARPPAPTPVIVDQQAETDGEDAEDNPFTDAADVDFGMKNAKPVDGVFVWPVREDALELCAGLIHAPTAISDLSFRLMTFVMKENSASGDKRLSEKQYGLLAGKLDTRYGKPAHRAILSALCQRVVTGEAMPGWKCKVLIDWLMNPEENAQKMEALDGVVAALKEAAAVPA